MKTMKLIAEAWKRFLTEANQVNVWPENENYKDRVYLGGDNFPVQGQIIKINANTLGNKTESSIEFLKSENKNSFVVKVAGRTFGRDVPELMNRGKNLIVISGKITSRNENSINTVFSITSQGIYDWKIENLRNSLNFKDLESEFDKIKNSTFDASLERDDALKQFKNQFNPLITSLEDILTALYRDFGDISLVQGSNIYSDNQNVNNYNRYDNAVELTRRVEALNGSLSRKYKLLGGQLKDIKIGGMIDKKDQAGERQGPLKEVNSFQDLFSKFPIDETKLEGKTGRWGCMDLAASLYSIITNKENKMSYAAEQFRKETTAMSSIFRSSSSEEIANYIEKNLGLEYRATQFGTNNADQNFLMALYYLTREGLNDPRVCVNLKGTALILQGNLNTVRANPGSVDSATERSRRLGRGDS